MRLNLWSSPRNISTAIMYSFAQRKDTAVVDEPLYAHYFLHQPTEAEHPGRAEVLASQENDGRKVIDHLLNHDFGRELVVFKQMTHHLIGLAEDFIDKLLFGHTAGPVVGNVLLIRDPRAILASFSKVVDTVTAEDIGLPQQYQLFQRLQTGGNLTAVVDAQRLLEDPQNQLKLLCEQLKVPFTPQMLSWTAGARPEDGVWAKYWYQNVHKSTGFKPYVPKEINLPSSLTAVAEQCAPIYKTLLAAAN